MVQYTATL